MKNYLKRATQCFALLLLITSCGKEDLPTSNDESRIKNPGFVENDMVLYWNQKTDTVLSAPMPQPTRTRHFAIIQIAVHDALNNIKPKYERFALNEKERLADPDAAVASAAYHAIKNLLPNTTFPIDAWYNKSLESVPEGESKELGKILGEKAALAIIDNRADDGFLKVLQTPQTMPLDGDEPGEYRSPLTLVLINGVFTPTYLQPPLKYVPNWGEVMEPYVIESNEQFRPEGPFEVTSANYTADFNEVKAKGARVNSTRTEAEAIQARFWSENKPSITWSNLTQEAIKTKRLDAWKTARLLALVHTCMAESIGSTLNTAYHFYYWRPETAIRLAGTDNNIDTEADDNWLPFINEVPNRFPSPPQPGYVSAFTTYGGSTAEILRLFFESDNTNIALESTTLPKSTRHFTSFSQAARENSISTIYLGWEFRKSALDGEKMGRQIANYVFIHHFRENTD